ncbi:barstar family protein [Saccharopolyspora hattusasensis]|uniref:barstar family protein n=1 Tax=Saccharopolyspora hattusasensis TaxID=1128679 RepID=UPI003D989A19
MSVELSWADVVAPGISSQGQPAVSEEWAFLVEADAAGFIEAISSLKDEPIAGGAYVVILNGAQCESGRDLFNEFSRKLNFPAYFGANWAAFDECLNDFVILNGRGMGSEFGDREGIHARMLLLAIVNADRILRNGTLAEWKAFLASLQRASTGANLSEITGKRELASLRVIFHCDTNGYSGLVRKMNSSNVNFRTK